LGLEHNAWFLSECPSIMPELPEVETTRRGLAPLTEGRVIETVTVRQPSLRWPIPPAIRQADRKSVV